MRVLEIFKEITAISHCSGNTDKLKQYIVDFANKNSLKVFIDNSKNILIQSKNPKICLQAHYDMVCVGEYKKIKTIVENGFLRAKNSSLGADNGIGVAIILAFLEEGYEIEGLFTNDEEIGLIGAFNLELQILSKYLLNLDSEEFGSIYTGCAGGFDIDVKIPLQSITKTNTMAIKTKNFLGGHSGIQIDQGIDNAIKELLFLIKKENLKLFYLEGGERSNMIPSNAYAITSQKDIKLNHLQFEIAPTKKTIYNLDEVFSLLLAFPTGVRSWDKKHNIPSSSINLAIVRIKNNELHINISARAMTKKLLQDLKIQTKEFFKNYSFVISKEYPAWHQEENDFLKILQRIYKNSQVKVIHAGLECGVLIQKLKVQALSIGPNIYNPHTVNEKVELSSVDKIINIIKDLLNDLSA